MTLPADFVVINRFAVGVTGPRADVVVSIVLGRQFTRAESLNLIAYLAVLGDLSDEEIAEARRAVEAA